MTIRKRGHEREFNYKKMNQYRHIFSRFVLVVMLLCASNTRAETTATLPQRIVSLAPSTTEILFDLGLGSKVVGVTRFCDEPASASAIAKVGGLMDANYEAIVSLKPDLVVMLNSQRDARRELEKMNIRTLATPHETIADIHESIRLIGAACSVEPAATRLRIDLIRRTKSIQQAVQGRTRPRVLICVGRDLDSGQLSGLYIAGRHGFYEEIIEAAGGVNAFEDEKIAYPQLAAEGVMRLDPDVIVDLVSMIKPTGKSAEQIARQWEPLRTVGAVRHHRVYVIVGNHALRPGPRYIQFLEELAQILHPEAFKKAPPHE